MEKEEIRKEFEKLEKILDKQDRDTEGAVCHDFKEAFAMTKLTELIE